MCSQSCLTLCKLMDSSSSHQAPLSMEFSRQEYCSGLLLPTPKDLPNPGIKLMSPALASGFFTTEPPGKPDSHLIISQCNNKKKNLTHAIYIVLFNIYCILSS